jgi:hypothetical protein
MCCEAYKVWEELYADLEELGLGHGRLRTELKIIMIHDGAAAMRGGVV